MKVYDKALSKIVFTLSVFLLANKLFAQVALNIFIQQENYIILKQIPNIYTLTDVMEIAILSCLLGISATYLLFSEYNSIYKHAPLIQSIDAEPADNSIAQEMLVTTNHNRNMENVLKVMKGNEPKIMKILLEFDELNQAELASRAGIPKSTLSRVLADLEKRSLVIRYESGMSKMVKLADSIQK